MNQPKRFLKVNMTELETAYELQDDLLEITYFLDLDTGEVQMTNSEERSLLEEIHETYADPESGEVDWSEVIPQLDLPDWEKESIQKADQVESGNGTRYLPVPQTTSREGYADMAEYIETVTSPSLKSQLERAIQGKGAFRRFKDVLLDHPQERESWFQFQGERTHQRIIDWLESEGIELI